LIVNLAVPVAVCTLEQLLGVIADNSKVLEALLKLVHVNGAASVPALGKRGDGQTMQVGYRAIGLGLGIEIDRTSSNSLVEILEGLDEGLLLLEL
jgi:hypothetical protein